MAKIRCRWSEHHELFIPYHDEEWGVPVHDDQKLFEMLCLEGAQAGLSWLTILKKRDAYRKAFERFHIQKVARYTAKKRAALLKDPGIVRHRLKINAVVENAKAAIGIQKEFGSLDRYLWQFVGGKPLIGRGEKSLRPEAEVMSKDLKKRGFRFVGPSICYAFMQAAGLVNDHSPNCFCARRSKR